MRPSSAYVGWLMAVMLAAALPPSSAAGQEWLGAGARAELEHELALVQHIRQHLEQPGDGLSLAADRRDLRRAIRSRQPATEPGEGPNAADLHLVAELWDLRVNDRVVFALMPRERLQRLERAQAALTPIASSTPVRDRDRLLPSLQAEIASLRALAQGRGAPGEAQIDLALALADRAALGQPVSAPGYGPPPAPPARPYPGTRTPPPGAYPPPSGAYPPPPRTGGGAPPPPTPPSSGTPPLPPGLAPYAQPQAQGNTTCTMARERAGESRSVEAMLQVAECWSRDRSWPGWGEQVLESLSWAVEYAWAARDCGALDAVTGKLRELGPPASRTDTHRLEAIARDLEERKVWLRSRQQCR